MRVIAFLALSFAAVSQAFMPASAPVSRTRGVMQMLKVCLCVCVCVYSYRSCCGNSEVVGI
jgi:hypothetical protein